MIINHKHLAVGSSSVVLRPTKIYYFWGLSLSHSTLSLFGLWSEKQERERERGLDLCLGGKKLRETPKWERKRMEKKREMFAGENGLQGDPRLKAISEAIRVVPHFPKQGLFFVFLGLLYYVSLWGVCSFEWFFFFFFFLCLSPLWFWGLGIMFQDITTLLLDHKAFKDTVDIFVDRYRDMGISVVAGILSLSHPFLSYFFSLEVFSFLYLIWDRGFNGITICQVAWWPYFSLILVFISFLNLLLVIGNVIKWVRRESFSLLRNFCFHFSLSSSKTLMGRDDFVWTLSLVESLFFLFSFLFIISCFIFTSSWVSKPGALWNIFQWLTMWFSALIWKSKSLQSYLFSFF